MRQRRRRLSAAAMDLVVEDYAAGMSVKAVEQNHGIGARTVLRNLRSRGISPRARYQLAIAGDDLQRLLKRRAQGWGYERIGRESGVSRTTVRNELNRDARK